MEELQLIVVSKSETEEEKIYNLLTLLNLKADYVLNKLEQRKKKINNK